MKKKGLLLILLIKVGACFAVDVDITKYGAKGDGTTLNTLAIQNAIDDCAKKGGGRVVFPAGTFLSGTIALKSNIILLLQKGANLLGSTNVEDYRNIDPFTDGLGVDVGWALLVAVDVQHVGIEGEGTIDGQGAKLKERQLLIDTRPESQRWGRRPFLLRFVRCEGVKVKAVTLHYAAAWTSHYFQCRQVQIENVRILSRGVAHNDGIDIDGCQQVRIKNCDIVSGDDALCFKTTSSQMPCKDIVVTDMRLKSNQGAIKMGTESMAPFENIKISRCYIYDTNNGGIKLLTVDGAHLHNVEVSDITMSEVKTPILVRLGSRLSVFRKETDTRQRTGILDNVVIRNVKAKAADTAQLMPPSGILITGVPDHYITNLTLENIEIDLAGKGTRENARQQVPEAIDKYPEVKTFGPLLPAYGVWARHVQGLKLINLTFRLANNDWRPAVVCEDGKDIEITRCYFPMPSAGEAVITLRKVVGARIDAGLSTLIDSTPTAISQWVSPDAQGKLLYKTTERGDKIMDFSQAGYKGGGVAIPNPPAKITLSPSPGDNTDAIQQAIDQISKMPMLNGSRGAVLLTPGVYPCERTIKIPTSGVVLRGSGSGEQGTTLQLTGEPHACISVKGGVTYQLKGEPTRLADTYVPSGTNSFTVIDASGFAIGDTIRITRPVTEAWIQFMGMNELVRNGKKQTWLNGEITTDRVIRKIEKNKMTVEVPLTDSYDTKYLNPPGVTVTKVASTGELSDIGIENFRIVSPDQTGTIDEHHHTAFSLGGLTDGWVRDIEIFNTVNSISVTGRRITLDNIHITHNLPTTGAAKPADLNGSGSQLLFNQCTITGDNLFFFATGAKVSGPIVLLHCTFRGNGWIQPHQRWATGLLVDGCSVPDGGIDFMNRGEMGSGHGWAIGWAVAWNCKAKSFLNQQPPGAANWVIGSQGEPQQRAIPFETQPLLPEGLYDSHGKPVTPASLYLAQLAERLGSPGLQSQ